VASDNVIGGVEVLSRRVLDAAAIAHGEVVHFCLVGLSKQSLIALDTRLLIVKRGFLAGSTGGARKTVFDYASITNVEINTGWVNGVIEILTSAYPGGVQKDFWNMGDNTDPMKASNTVPFSKRKLNEFQPYLDHLNGMVMASRQSQPLTASATSLPDQIRQLHDLVQAGALTAEEFEQAKRRLLA